MFDIVKPQSNANSKINASLQSKSAAPFLKAANTKRVSGFRPYSKDSNYKAASACCYW